MLAGRFFRVSVKLAGVLELTTARAASVRRGGGVERTLKEPKNNVYIYMCVCVRRGRKSLLVVQQLYRIHLPPGPYVTQFM